MLRESVIYIKKVLRKANMNDLEYQTIGEVEKDHWWFQHRLSKVKNVLQKESEKKKYALNIFDIGCGAGGLLFELKKNNFINKTSGCEPHPIGFEFCQKRKLSVQNCTLNNLKNDNEVYDAVLCMDVLYHKDINPVESFQNIKRLLKPSGILVLNVAALSCLKNSHDINVMGARRFNLGALRKLAIKNGFIIHQLYYWNIFLTPLIYLKAKIDYLYPSLNQGQSSLRLPNKFFNKFLKVMLKIEKLFLNYINFPFGTSLFLVCEKITK